MTNKVWISCNACGADAFTELSNVDGWHIGRCNKCSMIYLNPMPFFEPSTEFSDMSMDFQYTQFQHELSQQVLDHDNEQFHQHVKIMSQLAGHDIQPGKFLDIGCGSGSTVRVAKDLGWDAVGVDIDTKLIELGREKNKVDIRNSPLLESGFEANQFDFIRLRDVIEHLPNPYEVLLEVKRLLVPGGFALIATPNEDALPTQLRLLMGGKRDTVATVAPPHHVHGFTPTTLQRILDRAGLKVYQLKTTTPVDPTYVTARNMQSAESKLRVLIWHVANMMGKGSMLVSWIGKEKED